MPASDSKTTRDAISSWLKIGLPVALLLSGCDRVADFVDELSDAVLTSEPGPEGSSDPPASEPAPESQTEALPERPADSIAQSETNVITFRSILESPEMTREERIRAFQNLDPAALQKPVARSNVTGAPATADSQRRSGSPGEKRQPADWEIEAARKRLSVTMYSTAWCGVCQRAREYFAKNRIGFVEHDVDRDAVARAEYLSINPRRTVPTIMIEDEVIVGFSPQAVEHALNTAALSSIQ